MKKALLTLAALCTATLIAVCGAPHTKAAASGEGLKLSAPLQGEWKGPADQPQVLCRYELPQFEPLSEAAIAINRHYQAFDFEAWVTENTQLNFACTHLSERYVSVQLFFQPDGSFGQIGRVGAETFALDGMYAGSKLSLSQVLGMEQETSESVVSDAVYRLVWQIVEHNSLNAEGNYLDGMTEQSVRAAFQPETDFRLDADGNIVFFIQPGEIAGEIAGVLEFPFSASELMSEW